MEEVERGVNVYLSRVCRLRRTAAAGAALALCLASTVSCNSNLLDSGRTASLLVIEQFQAASGADPTVFSNTLQSDVVTNVETTVGGQTVLVPTVFEDSGRIIARLAFKDPGTAANPTTPTSANFLTVERYRVEYIRADGRNTPGVDVPHPFDGAATFSVLDIGSMTFTLVRVQAKLEPPLRQLRSAGGAVAISAIAEVTLFARDQTGAQTTAVGRLLITFADFGDPQ